ncbi:MAG: hypothetical protein NWE95_07865 [Candidatus Bathyarchaeota archaeon]|nr:hypothetical protein [Candidatus Bathyarchaeota archaeon]
MAKFNKPPRGMLSKNLLEMRLVKRVVVLSAVVVFILLVGLITAINYTASSSTKKEPFYVGVTYCGNSVAEAKLLIDKVKGYTNLFVLQSGQLLIYPSAINEVGDYAVNAGMSFIIYFGTDSMWTIKLWMDTYDGHWNNSFLGIYFGDELGGKMLDSNRNFHDKQPDTIITKYASGGLQVNKNGTWTTYDPDGTIMVSGTQSYDNGNPTAVTITYFVNGTITVTTQQMKPSHATDDSNITIWEYGEPVTVVVEDKSTLEYTYEELWNARPFQTYDEVTKRFVEEGKSELDKLRPLNYTLITSDYGLYWFDYLSGYDVVLAQLGWNHSTTQDIALVRGAANLQNKSWGTIITWKYTQEPYLASEQEIYDQMRLSYECGAEYVVVFNYAENMTGPYGTLQEEHFRALERFWNEVVQNPFVAHGGVKAEAAFVLPENCGWGLRDINDTVWGLWKPTAEYQQFWPRLQDALVRHGQRLDIIIDDSAFPVAGKYSQIYYWNQTS